MDINPTAEGKPPPRGHGGKHTRRELRGRVEHPQTVTRDHPPDQSVPPAHYPYPSPGWRAYPPHPPPHYYPSYEEDRQHRRARLHYDGDY
jgi:hypothetical protein